MSVESFSALDLAREIANNPFDQRLIDEPEATARKLIEYALNTGEPGRSKENMHHLGLHSLLLVDRDKTTIPGSDVPGGKIRLFIAEVGEHPLGEHFNPQSDDFNCLPHPHDFDLAIVPVVNSLNHVTNAESTEHHGHEWWKYDFTPATNTGEYRLNRIGKKPKQMDVPYNLKVDPGDSLILEDNVVHSLSAYALGKEPLAWIVVEGPEKGKQDQLYSKTDCLALDATNLYSDATTARYMYLLEDTLKRMDDGAYY